MKAYNIKRIIVGIMLVILTLGFCLVGTGAARADNMGRPPMNGQQGGFSGRGQFGPGNQNMTDGENAFGGQFGPGGQNMTDGENAFGGQFGPDAQNMTDGENSFGGQFGPDAQNMTDGENSFGGRGFGPGGRGGRNGFGPMDGGVREAIEALEDGETKTALQSLLEDVHSAMEALRQADDESRESAEATVKAARDALNEALSAAGIETELTPPEMPEGDAGMMPPEPFGGDMPERFNFDELSEEQIETLYQRFQSWLDSKA